MSKEYDIVSKQVLNQKTGELETLDFKRFKDENKKRIKGGFAMAYKIYEDTMVKAIDSKESLKLFHEITNTFTASEPTQKIVYSKYQNICSKPTFTKLVKTLVQEKYLYRLGGGFYRLNPFAYLPYKANGVELQKWWNENVTGKEGE